MVRSRAIAAVAAICISPAVVAAVDQKIIDGCNDCHGANGVSVAQDVPTIAGVSSVAISDALKAYKSKARPFPRTNLKRGDDEGHGRSGGSGTRRVFLEALLRAAQAAV